MGWLSAIGMGFQIFNGLRSYSQNKAAGQAGYQQGLYNSQQSSYFGQLNAGAMMEAAHINAGMTMEIGNLNADYILRAGERNLKMYEIQSEEELRRHIRAEKMHAGSVRAAQSGTGIQVNTGSALHYLNDQIDEGLAQRSFMITRHTETKKSIRMDFEDRAYVTRKSAELQAGAIMANGEIGAEMALAQSQYQSQQYLQAGQSALQQGNSAATGALLGTLGSVAKWGIQNDVFSGFSSMFAGSSSSNPPPAMVTASSTVPTMLRAPDSAGAPIPYATPVYTKRWASDFLTGVM
jgi:hypothetical protein